jgi:gamma-glutamylputrescine oxidase
MSVDATDPASPALPFGLALDWGTVYWRQAPNGAVLAGGLGQLDRPSDPRRHQAVSHLVQHEVARTIDRVFPGRKLPQVRRRWAGLMDATPDRRSIVDRLPETGVWVAAGWPATGFRPRSESAALSQPASMRERSPPKSCRMVLHDLHNAVPERRRT